MARKMARKPCAASLSWEPQPTDSGGRREAPGSPMGAAKHLRNPRGAWVSPRSGSRRRARCVLLLRGRHGNVVPDCQYATTGWSSARVQSESRAEAALWNWTSRQAGRLGPSRYPDNRALRASPKPKLLAVILPAAFSSTLNEGHDPIRGQTVCADLRDAAPEWRGYGWSCGARAISLADPEALAATSRSSAEPCRLIALPRCALGRSSPCAPRTPGTPLLSAVSRGSAPPPRWRR